MIFSCKGFPPHMGHPSGWRETAASHTALSEWDDEAVVDSAVR